MTIDWSDEFQNANESIHIKLDGESNEIDRNERHCEKQDQQTISTLRGWLLCQEKSLLDLAAIWKELFSYDGQFPFISDSSLSSDSIRWIFYCSFPIVDHLHCSVFIEACQFHGVLFYCMGSAVYLYDGAGYATCSFLTVVRCVHWSEIANLCNSGSPLPSILIWNFCNISAGAAILKGQSVGMSHQCIFIVTSIELKLSNTQGPKFIVPVHRNTVDRTLLAWAVNAIWFWPRDSRIVSPIIWIEEAEGGSHKQSRWRSICIGRG
jgi:hypothetical protein